ncbi:MAG: ABC transporter ATP-binding protein [Armatimonadetes bacterium]|nr:ABC transporter ATP-binding protein [Armatimonadota bacterium]
MITVRQLRYRIDEKGILHDVNLRIQRGETVSVMGVSGSGKTTLLKIIAGLIRPTSGQVFVDLSDITKLSEEELNRVRHRLGVVFQYGALFDSLTVYDNVAFALIRHTHLSKAEIDDIVDEKLGLVGLPGTQNLMPSQLSGGMQKRVGLARAIAMSPEVLLYDEPTSGLDPVMTTVIDDLIMEMHDRLGVTSVIVSHALPSIFRISDRIAMLHDGMIIAYGAPDEIRGSSDERVQQFIQGKSEGPIQPGEIA